MRMSCRVERGRVHTGRSYNEWGVEGYAHAMYVHMQDPHTAKRQGYC